MGRYVIVGLISIVCLASAVYFVGIDAIANALVEVDFGALLLATVLIVFSNLFAILRFGKALKVFNVAIGWRDLLFAYSVGQVSNHFLFNILGQSVSRAIVLERAGVPVGASVMATYVERLLAAGLLFVFALAGLWFLLRYISFDLALGGGYILFLGISAVLVSIAALWSLMGSRFYGALKGGSAWFLRLWSCVALTVVIHGLTLAGYAVIIESMGPGSFTFPVISALLIVMFTASLPISFSGWGVRELSAASALSLVDLPSSTAVSAAVAVGILSFVVMAAFAFVSLALKRGARKPVPRLPLDSKEHVFQWDLVLIQGCAFFCAIFVFFQLRVPLAAGALTVNIADVGAMTALGLSAYLFATGRLHHPLPRFIVIALVIVSTLLGIGMLSALLQDSLGRWALINRGVGWLVILGYVAAGALAVVFLGERIRRQIVKTVLVAGLAVCTIQLVMVIYDEAIAQIPRDIFFMPLEGFVNNQNAFAFQLMIVAVCLIVGLRVGLFGQHRSLFMSAILLLTLTLYYSKSRVGLIMLLLLAAAIWALSFRAFFDSVVEKRQLRVAAAVIPMTMLIAILLPYLIYSLAVFFADASPSMLTALTSSNSLGVKVTHDLSDTERIEIFTQAWALWLEQPLFGGGLGSFVEWRLAHGYKAQVIHSIPLWLMVEVGLVGLVVLVATSLWLFRHAWSMIGTPWGLGLVGILLCMAVGGLLHDFFFQRIFWFLLGVFCAVPATGTTELSSRETAYARA